MTRCYRVTLESEANTRRDIYVVAGDLTPGSGPSSAAYNALFVVETEDWKVAGERIVELAEVGPGFVSPLGT